VTLLRRPATVAEAGPGPYAAGCTALQLSWGEGAPDALTDIVGLAEARGVRIVDGRLRVGALETLERCRTDALVLAHAPLLAQACGVIGALGVRMLGTLGGNIGWRQGDTVPALLALDAWIETADGLLPLADALALPDLPLVLAVHVPQQPPVAVFEKTGHRAAFSLSAITVAGCVDGRVVRLAASAAGHPAQRLRQAETCFGAGQTAFAAAIANEIGWGPGVIAGRVLSGLLFTALAA
jgi:CO/xanthine dehydrogenase FAD-binding subunit